MLSRICSKIKYLQLGKRINQCYYNKNREIKTFANTSILSQELNFLVKTPNLSQQQLNVSDRNSILSQQTLNFPENSILSQQPLRITPGYQNIEPPSSILSHDTLINNLKNSSNISTFGQKFNKNYLKPLCLGQNRSRNLHRLHNFGSKNVFTNGNLSYNLSSSSNPSIFGQKFHKNHIMKPTLLCQNYCRNLHTLNNFGFTSIFNQNTLSKNFEKSSVLSYQPCRFLKLLEYQGDEILQETGIPTGKFVVVKNADEAEKMAESMQASDFMVKAQVLTGGRGKGKFKNSKISGVRTATSPAEVQKICKKMLGDYLVTKQTSDDGIVCNAVLVAERHFPRKEFYFAITMHRAFDGAVVIASTQGGMDIEEVAIVDPEAVLYEPIDAIKGLQLDQALEITKKLKIVETPEKLAEILVNLYKIFQKDAVLVELNPLALDIHNNYLCLDCKMEFDESADFKQPEIFAKKDVSQLDSRELAAIQQNINYVALSGNIGCMVNGAGLAMATMDIIKLHGGEPANFLDVGGGATVKTVETCFEIITSNKQVDCIFVNIFGGIMRCDIIAQGIVAAAQKLKDKQMPIVCRLRGTNVAEAKAIIAASELRILTIDDLDECAKVVVKVSKIRHLAKEVSLDVNFELLGI